ncbi:MAG: hypothetical protein A4E29_01854 [Methanomassiliicoccales archaeon PtaB.Bin134]|nr:MAG: hypothetical protein A4E29_01854 [Methanomassiliicoccales archaeon PtaB.Bin134]
MSNLCPAMAATLPHHAPEALTTTSGRTLILRSPLPSTARTMRPSLTCRDVTGVWVSTVAPASRALSAIPHTRKKGSTDASGTLTAAEISLEMFGSERRASLILISSALTPAPRHPSRKRSR